VLPTHLAFRTVAAVAALAFVAGCLAAVANAQAPAPSPTQRTLIAVGTGVVKVTPKNRTSNASIADAVEVAETKALPAALADARSQATELATAAGVTLGPLISLSNSTTSAGVFYGPYYPTTGTFGPGKYCGNVRTRSVTTGKDGKRHVGKLHTRRTCRIPPSAQRSVQLTFALN
jgi:uncharacterized protein YggE